MHELGRILAALDGLNQRRLLVLQRYFRKVWERFHWRNRGIERISPISERPFPDLMQKLNDCTSVSYQ
jgi:hypothetical protein